MSHEAIKLTKKLMLEQEQMIGVESWRYTTKQLLALDNYIAEQVVEAFPGLTREQVLVEMSRLVEKETKRTMGRVRRFMRGLGS